MNFHNLEFVNNSLKVGKLDFNRIKNFCAKNTTKKVARENISKYISDKDPVPRIYKEHIQLNNKKTKDKQSNLKTGKGLEQILLQDTQMTNKCKSSSLGKCKLETIMRNQFTLTRMIIIKK